jgi:hypothetical protein
VQIKVVAKNSRGDHWIVSVLLLQRCKLIKGGLVDDHVFLDPAHLSFAGLGLKEAPSMLNNLQRLSIADQSDSIRYSGNAVAQIGLLRDHVNHLRLEMFAQTGATTQRGKQSDPYQEANKPARAISAEEL